MASNEQKPESISVVARVGDITLTIEGECDGKKVMLRKKLDGQCFEGESFDQCLGRLSKLVVVYGDLTF
jgi:hypothetical protein